MFTLSKSVSFFYTVHVCIVSTNYYPVDNQTVNQMFNRDMTWHKCFDMTQTLCFGLIRYFFRTGQQLLASQEKLIKPKLTSQTFHLCFSPFVVLSHLSQGPRLAGRRQSVRAGALARPLRRGWRPPGVPGRAPGAPRRLLWAPPPQPVRRDRGSGPARRWLARARPGIRGLQRQGKVEILAVHLSTEKPSSYSALCSTASYA